mmetsp:Transcript_16245/g.41816  ORF Transcript_16245/g.41816 Transcript_16245/m.41816 type:complete len:89 (-) Transcript_16245:234-500(-)
MSPDVPALNILYLHAKVNRHNLSWSADTYVYSEMNGQEMVWANGERSAGSKIVPLRASTSETQKNSRRSLGVSSGSRSAKLSLPLPPK